MWKPLGILILKIRKLKFVGGRSTANLERIREDIARITSDNVDPGGRSINGQLGKDPQSPIEVGGEGREGSIDGQLGKDPQSPREVGREGRGGQSMANLERICEDIARITSDNVDCGGSINGQLGKGLQSPREDPC